jgi:hypothetical protein
MNIKAQTAELNREAEAIASIHETMLAELSAIAEAHSKLSPTAFAKLRNDIGNGYAPQLSASQRTYAEAIYSQLQRAQTLMWDLSNELERVIGCAVDTTRDLANGDDLDSILERNEAI